MCIRDRPRPFGKDGVVSRFQGVVLLWLCKTRACDIASDSPPRCSQIAHPAEEQCSTPPCVAHNHRNE
eukprot:5908566-Alexandrium_andersonii.AAC.1